MESTESTGSSPSAARKAASFLWMYALVLVLALVVLGIGIYQVAAGGRNYAMLAAGMVSVIADCDCGSTLNELVPLGSRLAKMVARFSTWFCG